MSAEDLEGYTLLARRVEPGSTLLRAWPLAGGVSAQVTAMKVLLPNGATRKMVVRLHGVVDRDRNPRIAEDEHRLLQLLNEKGFPVPASYYVDAAGHALGSPCVVVEYIEGRAGPGGAKLPGAVAEMAALLARVHSVTPEHANLSFLPRQQEAYARRPEKRPDRLDESIGEGQIREALEAWRPPTPRNPDALLHGDYWPGNILWRDGRLVGIVDWEDASVGDPVEDVANSRLEILWAYGADAMREFTERYRAASGIDLAQLPYWDLCAARRPAGKIAEWAGGEAREKVMRERHRWFVEQALGADLHFR